MRVIITLLVSMLLLPLVAGETGHLTLLAVSERGDELVGNLADLTLDMRPGTGRIFIATNPLTKLDTQFSTRFANAIACDFLEIECTHYDFFYTIDSHSPIVGGPSAGAAIAVLTAAMLDGAAVDQQISITGTINAGGIIGPVGGVMEKVHAAASNGMETVIIPSGSRYLTIDNATADLVSVGEELGITVIEVARLDQALELFTGRTYVKETRNLEISAAYEETMRSLAEDLCDRSDKLQNDIGPVTNISNLSLIAAQNLSDQGTYSYDERSYYSSASYCFGANVRYRFASIAERELSSIEIRRLLELTRDTAQDTEKKVINRGYKTLTDLQAYVVVMERLLESEDHLTTAEMAIEEDRLVDAAWALANGMERLYSAFSWDSFSGKDGEHVEINKDAVQNSCQAKLNEAEERFQYAQLFFPLGLEDTRRELHRAQEDAADGQYELCLFKASKAKAEADVFLSLLGVDEDQVKPLLAERIQLAKESIVDQQERGEFPIVGYSYYEYARSLQERDQFSAMLYSGYALELSNLDVFLSRKQSLKPFSFSLPRIDFYYGIGVGMVITLGIFLT
ncbi:MAG: S16 family serine protease, partial [Nanoarchaeota archaeon]